MRYITGMHNVVQFSSVFLTALINPPHSPPHSPPQSLNFPSSYHQNPYVRPIFFPIITRVQRAPFFQILTPESRISFQFYMLLCPEFINVINSSLHQHQTSYVINPILLDISRECLMFTEFSSVFSLERIIFANFPDIPQTRMSAQFFPQLSPECNARLFFLVITANCRIFAIFNNEHIIYSFQTAIKMARLICAPKCPPHYHQSAQTQAPNFSGHISRIHNIRLTFLIIITEAHNFPGNYRYRSYIRPTFLVIIMRTHMCPNFRTVYHQSTYTSVVALI